MTLQIRSFQPGNLTDMGGIVSVLQQAIPRDPISIALFTRRVLLDANFRPEGLAIAELDGRVIGICLAVARQVPLENAPPDADRGYITLLGVLPDYRRQGIGSRLLAHAEDYLRSQGRTLCLISPYSPGYFIPGPDVEANASGLEFLTHHGYRELYRAISMEAPLWDCVKPAWVKEQEERLQIEGVRWGPYCPEWTLPLLEFAQQEFPGDWVRVLRETMGRMLLSDPAGRIHLAFTDGRVLGFVHTENERFGPIGVAQAERGRGLGQVLMFQAIQAMRFQGFRTAWFLWSDERTARRLYDSAGFRIARRFAILKREL